MITVDANLTLFAWYKFRLKSFVPTSFGLEYLPLSLKAEQEQQLVIYLLKDLVFFEKSGLLFSLFDQYFSHIIIKPTMKISAQSS